jgi:putative acetyltransferase
MFLETPRLILRPFCIEDLADFNEYASQSDVGPNAGWKPHASIDESKAILDMFCNNPNESAIVYKESGKVIGSLGIKYGENGQTRVGYVMNHDYWGKGLMTETVKEVIRHIFTSTPTGKVVIMHFPHNTRSRRVIEKCGLSYVNTKTGGYTLYDGTPVDLLVWEITRQEWINGK